MFEDYHWQLIRPTAVLLVSCAAALLIHFVIYLVAARLARRTVGIADSSFVEHTRASARVFFLAVAVHFTLPAIPGAAAVPLLVQLATVFVVVSATWFVIRSVSVIDDVILDRHPLDGDDFLAREIHTRVRVLSRMIMTAVAVVGAGAAMMAFPLVRQFGTSLLASAGVAGLLVGLAARASMANMIAGMQLAVTQPVRLEDVVTVAGEKGTVEEITATYVVVRKWDGRRLIVPLQDFIEKPFFNWTRRTTEILDAVHLYADYTVPVDAVRDEVRRIAGASEHWDGRRADLEVTGATERTVELRAVLSAEDSSKVWVLRCEMREKLIGFLQREYPECLPRVRAELSGAHGAPSEDKESQDESQDAQPDREDTRGLPGSKGGS